MSICRLCSIRIPIIKIRRSHGPHIIIMETLSIPGEKVHFGMGTWLSAAPRRSHDIILMSHLRFSVLNPYNFTVLFKNLFRLTSKKTPKLHIAGTLWGNSTVYHHSAITFNIMSHKISWDKLYFVSVLHTNKQHQLCRDASYCATSVEQIIVMHNTW